jgi:acyl dehydratase
VTEDQISQYAKISNDYNIIHFDDGIAQKSGFKGRIAHGLLAGGEISRILGTNFPGDGTIFMNYKNIFISPMYPGIKYKFVLSTPFNNEAGIFLCVVKVFDVENRLIMLSYNQLIKKK